MVFDELLQPFLEKRPVAVMTRACLEYAFAAEQLDALFQKVSTAQYHRRLAFSTMVDLLGAVVTRRQPSIHSAYRAAQERVGVSLAAVYAKLSNTETTLTEALVTDTAERLRCVMQQWPEKPQPFAGLRLKVLDGNFLAGTDHRLKVTRPYGSAVLPGMALVVQDHGTGLVTNIVVSEDAYTSERTLVYRLMPTFQVNDVIVADRNFFLTEFFEQLTARGAYFVIRYHAATHLKPEGEQVHQGSVETGEVYEQSVVLHGVRYRLIRIQLKTPTREGDTEILLVTNLPADRATALQVANSYRLRWRLESTFLEVTRSVVCEVPSLAHPKAALLVFALALCACNALRIVTRALEVSQGAAHPEEEVSSYYMVNELIGAYDGMEVVLPELIWQRFLRMTAAQFAAWLLQVASRANWSKYRKGKRGPKKPVEKIKGGRTSPHVSTKRLLEAETG